MNIVEPIYITTIISKYKCQPDEYMLGPLIRSKLQTSKKTLDIAKSLSIYRVECVCNPGCNINGKILHMYGCRYYDYKIIKDMKNINDELDFNKFIMDHTGKIYTTITGLYYLQNYYLSVNKNIELYDNDGYYQFFDRTVKFNGDALRGDIRWLYLIKREYKYHLSKYVWYLIILELCKLHLYANKKNKYMCPTCDNVLIFNENVTDQVIKLGKYCIDCNNCNNCNYLYKSLYSCNKCNDNVCKHCIDKYMVCYKCHNQRTL